MAHLTSDSIGFIGLGAMGVWMAGHLAEKLPKYTKLQVYDVIPDLVDGICAKYPERVVPASSPKEVADKSV